MEYALIAIILFLLVVYIIRRRSKNNVKILAQEDSLVLTGRDINESFTVSPQPSDAPAGAPDSSLQSLNNLCSVNSLQCDASTIQTNELRTIINSYKSALNTVDMDTLGDITSKWEFSTRRKMYNVSHNHSKVGELIYHLKDLDNQIFLQLYNGIGYDNNIITSILEKVENVKLKKENIGIKNNSSISKKIDLVYDILRAIQIKYNEFQNSADAFSFSQENNNTVNFLATENCRIKRISNPYRNFDYSVFHNTNIGCDNNEYMKGIEFEVNNGNFTKKVACCRIRNNLNESGIYYDSNNTDSIYSNNTQHDFLPDSQINCATNSNSPNYYPINSFMINTSNNNNQQAHYVILTRNYNIIGPRLDPVTNSFKLTDTNIQYSGDIINLSTMYKFQRDGRKLKNIRFNQYLHRVERGDLRMNSNSSSALEFDEIRSGNLTGFKTRLDNQFITNRMGTLVLQQTLNTSTPRDDQLFYLVDVSNGASTARSTNTSIRCINSASSSDGATTHEFTFSTQDNYNLNQFNEKSIMCGTNQHLSNIQIDTHSSDSTRRVFKGTCQNNSENNTVLNNKREQLFDMDISPPLNHSHAFDLNDKIHNFRDIANNLDVNLNNFSNQEKHTQLELFSSADNQYLSTYSGYTPLQKILIMMIKVKQMNINLNRVNIDYDGLYSYLTRQSRSVLMYSDLFPVSTAAPVVTTTTASVNQAALDAVPNEPLATTESPDLITTPSGMTLAPSASVNQGALYDVPDDPLTNTESPDSPITKNGQSSEAERPRTGKMPDEGSNNAARDLTGKGGGVTLD